ncbi:MAG: MBL fold metallo-hydrolase [Acetobacteraceae bacterium]|nr:MBL fold metallo-hydrolase [Acetobacteraceae bacterium]
MSVQFETLGNASVMVFADGKPLLATDPWLTGTCYFGSWALDHPLSDQQIRNMTSAEYIWISHGHPDHLHDQSLGMLPAGKKVLLPDHYDKDIYNNLRDRGFEVTIMAYRAWHTLAPDVRVMCIDNINQDAILVIEAEGSLIIDLNDSPLCGEPGFLRGLIARHKPEQTWLLALCSVDADMFNFVDDAGKSLAGPPEERKPGAVWTVARTAARLGVGNFCCSSSQHIYVRADSIWANPYRIGWTDMRRYWSRPEVRLIEPFVTVDLRSGDFTRNHPAQISDESQISAATGDDDWTSAMTEAEWAKVDAFMRRFQLIKRYTLLTQESENPWDR